MTSGYVRWKPAPDEQHCVLDSLVGLDDAFALTHGGKLAPPAPVQARLHPDWPQASPHDNVANVLGIIVASERLAAWFRTRGIAHIEHLPVTLVDHGGAPLREPYWLLHTVDCIDALELEGAVVERSFILPDEIESVLPLRLRAEPIPNDQPVFRCKHFTEVFVRRDIANALVAEGFTGLHWAELDHA
jgi:hypothetical protein